MNGVTNAGEKMLLVIISLFACGLYAAENPVPGEKVAALTALRYSCSPPLNIPKSPYQEERIIEKPDTNRKKVIVPALKPKSVIDSKKKNAEEGVFEMEL